MAFDLGWHCLPQQFLQGSESEMPPVCGWLPLSSPVWPSQLSRTCTHSASYSILGSCKRHLKLMQSPPQPQPALPESPPLSPRNIRPSCYSAQKALSPLTLLFHPPLIDFAGKILPTLLCKMSRMSSFVILTDALVQSSVVSYLDFASSTSSSYSSYWLQDRASLLLLIS